MKPTAIFGGGVSEEAAERLAQKMFEESMQIYNALKEKHGKPAANLMSELANLLNIAKLSAIKEGPNNAVCESLKESIGIITKAAVELTKIPAEEFQNAVIAIARARSYSDESDPATSTQH